MIASIDFHPVKLPCAAYFYFFFIRHICKVNWRMCEINTYTFGLELTVRSLRFQLWNPKLKVAVMRCFGCQRPVKLIEEEVEPGASSSNSLVVGNLNVPPDWGWDKKLVPWLSYYWFWYYRNDLFLKYVYYFLLWCMLFVFLSCLLKRFKWGAMVSFL